MPIRCNPRFVHPIENVTVRVRMVERKIPTNNVIHVAVMVVIYAVSFFIKTSPCPPDIYVDTFFRIDLFHRRLVGPSIDSELPAVDERGRCGKRYRRKYREGMGRF